MILPFSLMLLGFAFAIYGRINANKNVIFATSFRSKRERESFEYFTTGTWWIGHPPQSVCAIKKAHNINKAHTHTHAVIE